MLVMVGKVIVWLALIAASSAWDIDSDSAAGILTVTLNGVTVIKHDKATPCLFIGSGNTIFKEYHGNFDVTDYIAKRIPLDKISNRDSKITFMTSSDDTLQVSLEFVEEDNISKIRVSKLPTGFDRVWIRFDAEKADRVYGAGEQFTYFNLRHRRYPIWTREQGVGRNKSTYITFMTDVLGGGAGGDYHTTYYGEPTFFSTRKYMIHSQATTYTILDFTNDNYHEMEVHGNIGTIEVDGGSDKTLAQLSQNYAKRTGLAPKLPDWIFSGAIVGVQGGTQRMLDIYEKVKNQEVAVSALWIQDWAGKITTSFGKRVFWNWELDPKQYPRLKEEIAKLKQEGVRVLTYINPHLNVEGRLFKEADQRGHFVKNSMGQTFISDFGEFYCGTIDLTNPDAVNWYKTRIVKRLIDLGISGYMADFGEYLDINGVRFHNGSGPQLHNLWPLLWAKLNREAVKENNKLGEVVFWMRAGYSGVSKYSTLMWAGDQNVDFTRSDGLLSTIPAALSIGLQGSGMTHFDIGGYTSLLTLVRTKELFLRSAEAAVFTPVMRTHEGNRPSENWQLYSDDNTMQQFARLVKMYKALSKYTKNIMHTYTKTGKPLQRPLFYQYPGDTKSWEIEDQYMYGDELVVAPIVEANVTSRTCYLPPGKWIHLWSNLLYTGPTSVKISSPLGQPPVFYKEGSSYDWQKLKLPLVVEPTSPAPTTSSSKGLVSTFAFMFYMLLTVMVFQI